MVPAVPEVGEAADCRTYAERAQRAEQPGPLAQPEAARLNLHVRRLRPLQLLHYRPSRRPGAVARIRAAWRSSGRARVRAACELDCREREKRANRQHKSSDCILKWKRSAGRSSKMQ